MSDLTIPENRSDLAALIAHAWTLGVPRLLKITIHGGHFVIWRDAMRGGRAVFGYAGANENAIERMIDRYGPADYFPGFLALSEHEETPALTLPA